MEFIVDNLVWFIVGGVIVLMTIIGYFAEKTNFGNKTPDENEIDNDSQLEAIEIKKEKKEKKPKKEKHKKEEAVIETNLDNSENLASLPVENTIDNDSANSTLDSSNLEESPTITDNYENVNLGDTDLNENVLVDNLEVAPVVTTESIILPLDEEIKTTLDENSPISNEINDTTNPIIDDEIEEPVVITDDIVIPFEEKVLPLEDETIAPIISEPIVSPVGIVVDDVVNNDVESTMETEEEDIWKF